MALVSVVRSYNFSKAELDGSVWTTLDQSEPAKTIRLSASLELLCPESVTVSTSFPAKTEAYQPLLNTFRWTLGLEGDKFPWPDHLAEEAINVQLIFDIYDKSVSLYEVYGVLESLPPTRAIPESAGRRFGRNLLKALGSIAKESSIPLIKTAGPPLSELVANSLPSNDSKNETLWYLHRFYNEMLGKSFTSYGIEWRITNRLIRTVGSRLAGVVGVLFFHAPGPKAEQRQHDPQDPPIRARSLFGLKPKCKRKDWMYFTWRPAETLESRESLEWNKLSDCQANTKQVTIDLRMTTPSSEQTRSSLLSSLLIEP